MTITEILTASGVKFSKRDASEIGNLIFQKAKEQKVKHDKVPETIQVNNYPDTFIDEMQQTVAQYFTSKINNHGI